MARHSPVLHWWMFYGVLTLGMLITAFRWGDADVRLAAMVLTVLWIASNISHAFVPSPFNQYFPILDGAAGGLLVWLWRRDLVAWKVVLVVCFLADVAWHARYFTVGDRSRIAVYRYDLVLNLIYLAQLATVTSKPIIARMGWEP